MRKQRINSVAAVVLAVSVWNCQTPDPAPSPYEEGVYILNAGNFSQNNGSISFLARESKTVATDIFLAANARPLTGLLQDYSEINGKGLIVVDNTAVGQDKVEIVEIGTFKSRASIGAPDLENPREVVAAGPNKAYVSCWDVSGSFANGTFYKDPGYIAVINLNNSTVTKKIPALKGVERMVVAGSEAFVGSDPGYGANTGANTLLIIDLNTDEVKQRIDFDAPPQPIALDADGKLWMLIGPEMVRLDPASRVIEKRLTFPAAPSSVTPGADRRTFYYTLSGKTYRFATSATAISTANPIVNRSFSALGVDPVNGTLYGSVIPSYAQAGYVLRYQSNGTLIDSVRAEIAPSKFFFR